MVITNCPPNAEILETNWPASGFVLAERVALKKPQGSQKGKALWKMKVAKEAGEECYDPQA